MITNVKTLPWMLPRAIVLLSAVSLSLAQEVQPVRSPEIHSDRTVIFRFPALSANKVEVELEGGTRLPMTRDAEGLWTVTTKPLDPDYYGYIFVVDGVRLIDPSNPSIKPNLIWLQNVVHVPGAPPTLWEVADVPHGTLHHHFYKSGVVGDQRDYYVYAPPEYNPKAKTQYPVLYLLHGFSDDASGWTAVGKANVIFDNLIAQGKVKPMFVVMPLGYGTPEFVSTGIAAFEHNELRERNFNKFREVLLTEVMPQVEKTYRISKDRKTRAIAGLSMGGSESLLTGLNNVDKFAYVGAFSSGGLDSNFDRDFPALDSKTASQIRLLWIACGTDDHLITLNRQLKSWLKTKNVAFTDIETPGAHTWMVWRRNLIAFSSLLFKEK